MEAWKEQAKHLRAQAIRVLLCSDPHEKYRLTKEIASSWRGGGSDVGSRNECSIPERPARDGRVRVVDAKERKRRGKAGSLASRRSIIHGLVHVESWAIDLAWDALARFGETCDMPKAFYDDFVALAEDEARHFAMLEERLRSLGMEYGDLEEHEGLWESARRTLHSLAARLAVEHCTHEARGLDVLPSTIARFRNAGDHETADILENVVYPEEITHCRAGVRWFRYLYDAGQVFLDDGTKVIEKTVEEAFQHVVRAHFRGNLKPPFNETARNEAGLESSWYLPLAEEDESKSELSKQVH